MATCCAQAGFLPAADENQPQNAFGFFRADPYGDGCPLGSHVRRANPRDGLAPDQAAAQTLLDAANNHRILRRGRKYGTTLENPRVDDGQERGLLLDKAAAARDPGVRITRSSR